MESLHTIPKTDLARNTSQVIRTALRGQTVVVEHHGQPEVAIIDILDYRILRAVMRYHAHPAATSAEKGLTEGQVAELPTPKEKVDVVMAHYLAGHVSLGRAAELLGVPWLDLRTRFARLDVPLRLEPDEAAGTEADVAAAAGWLRRLP